MIMLSYDWESLLWCDFKAGHRQVLYHTVHMSAQHGTVAHQLPCPLEILKSVPVAELLPQQCCAFRSQLFERKCTHMRAMKRGLNCLCVGKLVMSHGSLYFPSLIYSRSLQQQQQRIRDTMRLKE